MKRPLSLLAILLTAAVFLLTDILFRKSADEYVYDKAEVEVFGRVSFREKKKSYSGQHLSVIYLDVAEGTPPEIKKKTLQVYLDEENHRPLRIGEYALIKGMKSDFLPPSNPGEFNSRLYYQTLKIAYRVSGARVLAVKGDFNPYREGLAKIRDSLESVLDGVLDERDSGVMKAMLLGDRAYMDGEIRDTYKASGLSHILAVSGLHISFLGMGLYRLLKRLSVMAAGIHGKRVSTGVRGWNRAVSVIFAGVLKSLPALISVIFMYSYGIMCGMGTSSFRAVLMFAIRLFGDLLGRSTDIITSLSVAELLLLLDQPLYLYNSGFLFSFLAVLGIAVVKPLMHPFSLREEVTGRKMKFADDKEPLPVLLIKRAVDGIESGAAIALATLPVYGLFFYTYPVFSIVLNLLVIPLTGVLMLLGVLSIFFGCIYVILQGLFSFRISLLAARLAGFGIHLILGIIAGTGNFPEITHSLTWYMGYVGRSRAIAYGLLLVLFCFFSSRLYKRLVNLRREKERREVAGTGKKLRPNKRDVLKHDFFRYLIILPAILILALRAEPELEISMIDVGQGDGIVVSTADGSILIDGGSTSEKNIGKYRLIPFLKYKGIKELRAVVMTHEDEDHVSGIFEILDDMEKGGIKVDKLIMPETSKDCRGDNYRELEKRAEKLFIPVLYINVGESFRLGSAGFTCLNPSYNMRVDGANEYSTVLYMESGKFSALLTGDMEGEGLEQVKKCLKNTEYSGGITLLKVAHHGSKYTTDEDFLKLVKPRFSIISCGRRNSYGHPHKELLERLSFAGSEIYRTDELGQITVSVTRGGTRVSVRGFMGKR